MHVQERQVVETYLSDPQVYVRLEQHFLGAFRAGIQAANLRAEDFRSRITTSSSSMVRKTAKSTTFSPLSI
ncbi:hypothetical protein C1922_03765 [Stenotrophomonas sp. ZAC14D2_NAIMI4_7]|uniref:hypothetical protein n=1 Tax=Stenotrophomonas sp. ZAC14D2_NAIMI4_7 TaxID=2072405 RepID=UPI000D53C860|nr:hypothetical protein [Stenotrophomonas sp. ZAC14D2_NAIMI4_7]AWH16507.1 hypothetical protein C1922_03765 [Stenotrophomonas sp. ZAC14D2_NAIMI4_7]